MVNISDYEIISILYVIDIIFGVGFITSYIIGTSYYGYILFNLVNESLYVLIFSFIGYSFAITIIPVILLLVILIYSSKYLLKIQNKKKETSGYYIFGL